MKKHPLHSQRLMLKIIGMFLCIVIPISGLIFWIFSQINGLVRANTFSSTQKQVTYDMAYVHNYIRQIYLFQQEYVNDLDLYSVALGSQVFEEKEITRIIGKLQSRLTHMNSTAGFSEDTTVYIYSLAKQVSSTLVRDAAGPEPDVDVAHRDSPCIINKDGDFYVVSSYPEQSFNSRPFFTISTRLNMANVSGFLSGLQYTTDCALALYNDQLQLLSCQGENAYELSQQYVNLRQNEKIADSGCFLEDGLLIASTSVDSPGMTMVSIYPEKTILRDFYILQTITGSLVAFTVISTLGFVLGIQGMVSRPLQILLNAFSKVESGHDDVHITYPLKDEFRDIYMHFNNMVDKFHQLIGQVYQQEIEAKRSELKQLQSQINPHFLYNCFFIIHNLCELEDMDTLADFTHSMGRYFQYITRSKKDEIMLQDEINHAQDYVNIQDIRFSNRIDVFFNPLPAQYKQTVIPRFILQPILENCYEHGFGTSVVSGTIEVNYTEEEGFLCIHISNSGDNITIEKCQELKRIMNEDIPTSECTGIVNVSRRLKLMFGHNNLLEIAPRQNGGVEVTVRIPLQEENKNA